MLARIAAFELRYQLRSPLFFIGFAIFFTLTFASETSWAVQLFASGNVNVNSPYTMVLTFMVMSIYGMFVATYFVAGVVIRDQDTNFAPILFTTRVRKRDYLIGRFVGAIGAALAVPVARRQPECPAEGPQRAAPQRAAGRSASAQAGGCGRHAYNYLDHDSDFVDAEIPVTTDADQIPLTPGYTVSDEVRDGRRTLVTRTEAPILQFFSIQSARYAIARDVWTGADGRKVDLAVYHYP